MIVRQRNPVVTRVNVVSRRRGIGDWVADAAAADALRGNAPSGGNTPWPTWAADNSWKSDPAGQALLTMFPFGNIDDSQTMYADGWASSFNQVASAQLAGRVAPNQTQLGISKAQTGCSYDMQLTIGQYWAALKAYNAGTWQPPTTQFCPGAQNPVYGPESSVLYPNIYIDPEWSGNAAPAGVTDATVQAQYASNQAAAAAQAAQAVATAAAAAAAQPGASAATQAAAAAAAQAAAAAKAAAAAAAAKVPSTSGSSISDWFSGSMISGIPNWALLAAAGVGAVFLFGGKRR